MKNSQLLNEPIIPTKEEKSLLEKATELLELDPLAFCESIGTLVFNYYPEDVILEAVEVVCSKREMALSVIQMMSPVKKPGFADGGKLINEMYQMIESICKPSDKSNSGYYRPLKEKIIS